MLTVKVPQRILNQRTFKKIIILMYKWNMKHINKNMKNNQVKIKSGIKMSVLYRFQT